MAMLGQKKTKKSGKRTALIVGLIALCVIVCVGLFLILGSNEVQDGPELGVYHYETVSDEYVLTLLSGRKFTLTVGADTKSGSYVLDGEAISLTFEGEKEAGATGTWNDTVLTLTYQGTAMRFLKEIPYTVIFESNGGSVVAAQTVTNGRKAQKPADPTKDGFLFIGWYADEALTKPFLFDSEMITGDVTVYAYWVQSIPGQADYTVSFDLNYAGAPAMEPQQTVGGRLINAPVPTREGYTFAGWFVSMYESGDKLTYKLDDSRVLTGSCTLYAAWVQTGSKAPVVSVENNKVSWSAVSGVLSYTLRVEGPAGFAAIETTDGSTTRTVDFANAPAGDYIITVSCSGGETVRYYKNKVLEPVTDFRVVDGNTLTFAPVDKAQKYYITVVCGNPAHEHENVELGSSTSYNFSNCKMQKGGILFTVTAAADGMLPSTSETFAFDRTLDAVQNIRLDEATELLSWDAVTGAEGYYITVSSAAGEQTTYVETVGCCLKTLAGEISVSIYPAADGYNSPDATAYVYNKTRLATPSGLEVSGKVLSWTSVGEGVSYTVSVNGTLLTADTNSITLTDVVSGENKITVMASKEGMEPSLWSDELTVMSNVAPQNLVYRDGKLTWNADIGAVGYEVKVGDGEAVTVTTNAAAVRFAAKGEQTLSVRCIAEEGEPSEWSSIRVAVYEVTLDTRGGSCETLTLYKAQGDSLSDMTAATHTYYNFVGWYTSPDEGTGAEVKATFAYDSDQVFYAQWSAKTFTATYEQNGDMTVGAVNVQIKYNTAFKLEVPAHKDATYGFAGWYSQEGTRLTDASGNGIGTWRQGDTTVYAQWIADIFEFVETTDDAGDTVYSVQAGENIGQVSIITVPRSYNDKPVAYIYSGAFKNCVNLTQVNVPDTMQVIGANAGDPSSSGPFAYCSSLVAVNVYETDTAAQKYYFSVDGVLCYNNPVTGMRQIAFVPFAKTGEFVIPDNIEQIPLQAFAGSKLSKITIPASVTEIGSSAFFNCSELTEVVFLNPADPQSAGVSIGDYAFRNCTKLQTVTLPNILSADMVGDAVIVGKLANIFMNDNSLMNIHVDGTGRDYSSKDGVLTNVNGTAIVYYPNGRTGEYTIPTGVNTIGYGAFMNHGYLTKITIPDTVRTVGDNAFQGAKLLEAVEFSSTAVSDGTTVGTGAFADCAKLKTVRFAPNSEVEVIGVSAFSNTGIVSFGRDVTADGAVIPDTVQSIGAYAFNGARFASVAFEARDNDRELAIGEYAFGDNGKLSKVTLSKNVYQISFNIFFGCTALRGIEVDADNPWYVSENGTVYSKDSYQTLYYYGGNDAEFTVPSQVTTIGQCAFANATKTKTVNIGGNVEMIGARAFEGCTALTQVNFASGTRPLSFGASAFKNCRALKRFDIPARATNISESMFENTLSLKTITMADNGITEIGSRAFAGSGVTELRLPASASQMGTGVFDSCVSLRAVTLPGITTIGSSMFVGCTALESVVIPESVRYINETAFKNATWLTEIELPSQLLGIGNGAFYGCTKLTAITIPKSVTEIGTDAFYLCKALRNITFESGGTGGLSIGNYAFAGSAVETVVLPSRLKTLGQDAFKDAASLKSLSFENNRVQDGFALPNAFAGAVNLTTVVLPTGLTTVEAYALQNSAITELTFPGSVTSIANSAIYNLKSLKKVTIEEGSEALTVATSAFLGCTALETVRFPSRLTSLGTQLTASYNTASGTNIEAYQDMNALREVIIPAGNRYTVEDHVVYDGNTLLFVLGGAAVDCITVKDGVQSIPDAAFSGAAAKKVVLPDSLKTIGKFAFANSGIQQICIPGSVTNVDQYAFSGCLSLKTVTFAKGTEKMTWGNGVFFKTGLTAVEIPARLKTLPKAAFAISDLSGGVTFEAGFTGNEISAHAFYGAKFTAFQIPDSVKYISGGAFAKTMLTQITIPKSVVGIETAKAVFSDKTDYVLGAFEGCTGLTAVTFEAGTDGLDISGLSNYTTGGAFCGCTALTAIELPARLTSVGDRCFAGCTNLKTLTFAAGSRLKTIKADAFSAIGITTLELPASLETLADRAFANCASLTAVHLPKSLKTVTPIVFENCVIKTLTVDGSNLVYYTNNDNVLYSRADNSLVYFPAGLSLTTYRVPEGIQIIGASAFGAAANASKTVTTAKVTNFYIPASVTKIDTAAFQYANVTNVYFDGVSKLQTIGGNAFAYSKVAKIHLPDSITSFGEMVFRDCTKLTDVQLPQNDKITELPTGIFSGCSKLKELTIPEGYKVIGMKTLNGTRLTKLILPDSLEEIQEAALDGLPLTEIRFPENPNFTRIEDRLFEDSKLEKVYIPDNVTYIGDSAFRASNGQGTITEIRLPSKLEYVGAQAFYGQSFETDLVFDGNLEYIGESAFEGVRITGLTFGNVPLEAIGKKAFYGAKITELSLPWSLQTVGEQAFASCENLQSVALNGVVNLGDSAFANCEALTYVELPDSLTTLGSGVFAGCTKLVANLAQNSAAFFMMDGLMYNAEGDTLVFVNAGALGSGDLQLSQLLTAIAPGAFAGSDYTTATIPEGVTVISRELFKDSKNLTHITLPAGIETIDDGAFEGCVNLQSITIGKNVTYVGANAFKDCTSLKEVIFEEGGTATMYLGESAFENCTSLTEIHFDARLRNHEYYSYNASTNKYSDRVTIVPAIGNKAFLGCVNLETVTFGEPGERMFYGAMSIGQEAFRGLTKLKEIVFPDYLGVWTALSGEPYYESYKVVGSHAFRDSGLEQVTFTEPTNTLVAARLGSYAFSGTKIRELILPAVYQLGMDYMTGNFDYEFAYCTELEYVKIPSGNFTAEYTFAGCTALKRVELYNPMPGMESTAMIGGYAFQGCTALEEVILPSQLRAIEWGAFDGCTALKELHLPAKVDNLGRRYASTAEEKAWQANQMQKLANFISGCVSLKLTLDPNNTSFVMENGVLYNKDKTVIYAMDPSYEGMFVVPDTVTAIIERAFAGCTKLTEVVLSATTTNYGNYLFAGCTGLKTADLTNYTPRYASGTYQGTTWIIKGMFSGCTALQTVLLPENAAGVYADIESFCNCASLIFDRSVVKYTGNDAFTGVPNP